MKDTVFPLVQGMISPLCTNGQVRQTGEEYLAAMVKGASLCGVLVPMFLTNYFDICRK